MVSVEVKLDAKVAAAAQAGVITGLIAAFLRNGNLVEGRLVQTGAREWSVHGIAPARDAFKVSSGMAK